MKLRVTVINGVNQMWILRIQKTNMSVFLPVALPFVQYTNFYIFFLYTILPHVKLKSVLRERIFQCFYRKQRIKIYVDQVLGREKTYLWKINSHWFY